MYTDPVKGRDFAHTLYKAWSACKGLYWILLNIYPDLCNMSCISVLCNIYEQVSFFPIQICFYREDIHLVHIKKTKKKNNVQMKFSFNITPE